jgi:hypothetical protein
MLCALILHALYTEAPENKSLVGVKRLSADLDATAKAMATTLHRRDHTGTAITDPYVHGGDKPGHWIVGDVPMRAV